MKNYKKLALATFMSISAFTVSAQDLPVRFGVEAGMNLSNAIISSNPWDKNSAKIGFQIGITAEYVASEKWSLQTGLSFTNKGIKVKNTKDFEGLDNKFTVNQNYLQLPLYGAYKLQISPSTKIVFNAGPYIALGVGGSTKADKGHLNIFSETKAIDTFGDDGFLNRFDFGSGFGAGVEFSKIVASLRYESSIINIGQSASGFKYRNQNASLTLGYKF